MTISVWFANQYSHLAAAASWFLALGADGSAATDFAVTSSLEDTMETFFNDTTICPWTSLSYNMNSANVTCRSP